MADQSPLVRLQRKHGLALLQDLLVERFSERTYKSIVLASTSLTKPPNYLGGIHPDWSQDKLFMWETNGCVHDMSHSDPNDNWIPYDYYQYTRQTVEYVNRHTHNRLRIAFRR